MSTGKFCNAEDAPQEDGALVEAARNVAPQYRHREVITAVLMATFEPLHEEEGLPNVAAMRMPKDAEAMFMVSGEFIERMNEAFAKNGMPFSMSLTSHHHMCGQKEVIVDGISDALVGTDSNGDDK